eukprot:TRINITY_DN763_c0_g1_i1.p2 TRINITY_DN763_c0_g1~~TRINITY_DN763_c0_g1_i1.p2  ORF type:complete len:253 (-),score=71.26 TRINITY_DN763_c0_g1_i1:260-1018(-)
MDISIAIKFDALAQFLAPLINNVKQSFEAYSKKRALVSDGDAKDQTCDAMNSPSGKSLCKNGLSDKDCTPLFTLPILTDPLNTILNIILGKPFGIVQFSPPEFTYLLGFSFPILTPFPALQMLFTIGFDTYGIMKAMDSGNPLLIFDGFYISNFAISVGESIGFGLQASLGPSKVSVTANIGWGISVLLADPTPEDNKFRVSDMTGFEKVNIEGTTTFGGTVEKQYSDIIGFKVNTDNPAADTVKIVGVLSD